MNCKPGDLAIIVRGPLPEWIGVQVTCVEYLGDTFVNDFSRQRVCVCHRAWEVSCPHPPLQLDAEIVISDDILMPIHPEPEPESERREEALSA